MQPIKILSQWLEQHANKKHYIFTLQDLRALFEDMHESAFKTFMSRAVKSGIIERICRGIYACKPMKYSGGLLLFHVAAYLRSGDFNYISLETALSDAGIISQIPMHYISIMTSGRSSKISCGNYGTIDFVHTQRMPQDMIDKLTYDVDYRLWRADIITAVEDMKHTRRSTIDLIDWEIVNEFVSQNDRSSNN